MIKNIFNGRVLAARGGRFTAPPLDEKGEQSIIIESDDPPIVTRYQD